MPLVTQSQIESLRSVVESGMETDVTILRAAQSDSPYGDDDETTFTTGVTVKGWLREVPQGTIDVVSGIVSTPGTYRLFLPVGTPIDPGDRALIGGKRYVVEDTNAESTYQVTLRVVLNRAE